MRCVVLAEYLTSLPSGDAVAALATLVRDGIHASQLAGAASLAALESLVGVLGDSELLPYTMRVELYTEAKEQGYHTVCRLLFEFAPVDEDRSAPRIPAAHRGHAASAREPSLPLGQRKSLARSHRRDVLVRLLRDPHPDVIRILLDNPRITESDVLALASHRADAIAAGPATGAYGRGHARRTRSGRGPVLSLVPVVAEPASPVRAVRPELLEVARNPRWGARYAVKRALVRNPYTPLALAMRLAITLRPRDLRTIADDPQLSSLLREHVADLLAGA